MGRLCNQQHTRAIRSGEERIVSVPVWTMSNKPKLWKWLLRFTKRILHSRLGQLLFVIHSVLVVYVFTQRGAGLSRPIHPHYESFWMNMLIWLDLPAIVLASLIAMPFEHGISQSSFWCAEFITGAILFLCASLQWWFIGYLIAVFFRPNSSIPS